ncbi:MAG: transcriptional regulator [Massilia sp.]
MANDFVTEASLREPSAGSLMMKTSASLAPSVSDLKKYRISKRESQEKFWGRFGVTQSSGSRFETGLAIPAPVALLLKLYVNGKLNDGDLLG